MDLQHFLTVFAALFVGMSYCQLDKLGHMFENQDSKKVYCGRRLSEMLSTVCQGRYNTLNKRLDPSENLYNSQYSYDTRRAVEYPFRTKSSATQMITSSYHRRRRRGVFNECCEKACSHEELRSYCGGRRR